MKAKASLVNYIFSLSNVGFAIVNGILLVPLYLHYINVELYGFWLAGSNIIGLLSVFEGGLATIITQKLSNALTNKKDEEFLNLSYANFFVSFFVCSIIVLLGIGISFLAPHLLSINKTESTQLVLALCFLSMSTGFTLFAHQLGAYPQVFQLTTIPGLNNLLSILISFASIFILLINGFGIISLAIGVFIRGLFFLIGNLIYVVFIWKKFKLGKPICSKKTNIDLVKECILPLASKISNSIINNSQSFIIGVFIGGAYTVIYDFTGKIISTLRILVSTIGGATFASLSIIFSGNNQNSKRESFFLVNQIHLNLLFIFSIISFLFSKSVIAIWVGKQFYGGDILLFFIVISVVIQERKSFFYLVLNMLGYFKKAAQWDIVNSITFILLLIILGKYKFGILAIPISIGLSSVLSLFMFQLYLKKNSNFGVFYGGKNYILASIISLILFFFYNLGFFDTTSIIKIFFSSIFIILSLVGFIAFSNKPLRIIISSKFFYFSGKPNRE